MNVERWLDDFGALGGGEHPTKKLGLLVRPAFVARPGTKFVWGDWSAIEARVLPWLAEAEEMVEVFRSNDADPTAPDVYRITAGKLLKKDPSEVTGDERQAYGKVPVLSLGFGGGLGALQAMATNYGVYLDDDTAEQVVRDWRDDNRWARRFWGSYNSEGSHGLWGAANSAIEHPDTLYEAGRVAYVYDPGYLRGTLFCGLPCGRLLTYPMVRWELREVTDKKTGETVERYQMTYRKGHGRAALWHGKLAENVTQGFAASILRRTLKRLDSPGFIHLPVVMHTHDEVVTEVPEGSADDAAQLLKWHMERNEDYDADLPLKAEITIRSYYTKAKG